MLARSVALDPLNVIAVESAAEEFLNFRRFAEAERFGNQWDRLVPGNTDPLELKASIALSDRGDTAEVLRLWNEADRRAPSPTVSMLVSYTQLSQGTARLATLNLNRVQARSRLDTLYYYLMIGSAQRRLGRAAAARAYSDSVLALSADHGTLPGILGVMWTHGSRSAAASLARNEAEYKREAELNLQGLAAYGARSWQLASWYCDVASDYASFGDIDGAISHARKCLTLPSGATTWNIRLDPNWQGILGKPQVQALLREYSR
jgi:hypothetical protein